MLLELIMNNYNVRVYVLISGWLTVLLKMYIYQNS